GAVHRAHGHVGRVTGDNHRGIDFDVGGALEAAVAHFARAEVVTQLELNVVGGVGQQDRLLELDGITAGRVRTQHDGTGVRGDQQAGDGASKQLLVEGHSI